MPNRRRRRDRRPRQVDHPDPPKGAPVDKTDKTQKRRRSEFNARMARMARTRTIVGLFGFVPLLASFGCATIDLGPLCIVPREIYLGLWAAIFGTFLGLTIRMWRERRAFERAAPAT